MKTQHSTIVLQALVIILRFDLNFFGFFVCLILLLGTVYVALAVLELTKISLSLTLVC